jgi:hypothetical protein
MLMLLLAGNPVRGLATYRPYPPALQDNSSLVDLKAQVTRYKDAFKLEDPYSKLVDNHGDGFEELYGVRNFRVVLYGVLYRGGANNSFNKHGKRWANNPLPDEAIDNACRQGFSEAIYLLNDNFNLAKTHAACTTAAGAMNELDYHQNVGVIRNAQVLLTRVYEHIKGKKKGPLFVHCYNGWHTSGLFAAISLKQFCGWSGDAAEAYWVKNVDGQTQGYDKTRQLIKTFRSYPTLSISSDEQTLICPTSSR